MAEREWPTTIASRTKDSHTEDNYYYYYYSVGRLLNFNVLLSFSLSQSTVSRVAFPFTLPVTL